MEEYKPTQQEENEIEYLAEILVEVYLESKGYKPYPWLNNETKWRKVVDSNTKKNNTFL